MEELLKAIASFGVSAKEAEETLNTLSELMHYIGAQSKINEHNKTSSDLRPASNAKTEIPNQKSDLEIFNQIVWDERILNFNPDDSFVDL